MTEPGALLFGAWLGFLLSAWFAYFVGVAMLSALHRLLRGDA